MNTYFCLLIVDMKLLSCDIPKKNVNAAHKISSVLIEKVK